MLSYGGTCDRSLSSAHAGELLVLSAALIFVVLGAYANSYGDAANSRLATVYALTEHGTFFIDPVDGVPNKFERRTIDKVEVDGRLLSSKPPMLPLLMTAQYIAMNRLLGWDLESDADTDEIVRYMAMLLMGGSYMLALVFFAKTLRLFYPEAHGERLLALVALAFCTQLWGFSTNINNHVPGTGMLMVALYFALGMGFGKLAPTPARFILFGLAGGLVCTLDMPATVFVVFAGLHLLIKFPRQALLFGVTAALIPVAMQSGALLATTGSPFPVQTDKQSYLYETSYWRHPRGVDSLNEPKGTYLFHMTLGRCGLFSLYPILLLGIVGTLRAVLRADTPNRGAILAGFAGFVIMTLYYAHGTNNYGGEAYGFRWYIVAMPVLLLMGAHVVSGLRKRWHWIFVGLMLGISFFSAWECSKRPWAANQEWTCRFLGPTY